MAQNGNTDDLGLSLRLDPPIALRGFGAFYVGGTTVDLQAGTGTFTTSTGETLDWPQSGNYAIGQLYAQAILPQDARPGVTLAFWHGGGMSGAQWDMTPDGRVGWLQMALADRFDCIVCDAAERGRAGIPHMAFTHEAPVFRSNELAWERFRIGPKDGYRPDPGTGQTYAGQLFPADSFDIFAKQFTARWPGFSDQVRKSYNAFLDKLGDGLVIIAHSEGARYAIECARGHGASIVGLVLIEPAGEPAMAAGEDSVSLTDIPVLTVWGDFIEKNERWIDLKARFDAFSATVPFARHDTLLLNEVGLPGHSHFPMIDHGNEHVWRAISNWIGSVATKDDRAAQHPGTGGQSDGTAHALSTGSAEETNQEII